MAKKRARVSRRPKRVSSSSKKVLSYGVPFPVKVISVLLFIDAIASFLVALASAIAYFSSFSIISALKLQKLIDVLSSPLGVTSLISLSILFFVFAFIDLVVSRGLWLGKNWARWIVIAFMAVVFVGAAINLDYISAILSLIIGAYFLLDKRIQASFK